MSKLVTLSVELVFESNIEQDKDIIEIAKNVARAIVNETNGEGIAPQNGDTYLEIIRVKPQFIDEKIVEQVIW